MKIAFLASLDVLPHATVRRSDAFEFDLQFACLSSACSEAGSEMHAVQWNDTSVNWAQYDAAFIGTCWDYQDQSELFLDKLDEIAAAGVRVFNPAELVRWNLRKTYLRELAARGVGTIETLWLDFPSADRLSQAFDELNTDELVIKRQVGAGASGQLRYNRGDQLVDYAHRAMVQPFVPSIVEEGEYSFIMINGVFSHALLKRAKTGDYRIQSSYGGYEEKVLPSKSDLEAAHQVVESFMEPPLYARVDMARGHHGRLLLMELELIEPYLYPEQSDQLGALFFAGLIQKMSR